MEDEDGHDGGSGKAAKDRRTRSSALNELQALVTEGLASGAPQPFDMETYLSQKRNGLGASES
jgi:hypothetical protein